MLAILSLVVHALPICMLTLLSVDEILLPIYVNWADFHTVINLSIAISAFLMYMLTSPSVDEILLLGYVNWSTNFRALPFNADACSVGGC